MFDLRYHVVSLAAVDTAVEVARRHGVAVVTACNTWFSGRCAYYVERAARQGFVALHTTNTTARVAPFGGAERLTLLLARRLSERGHEVTIVGRGASRLGAAARAAGLPVVEMHMAGDFEPRAVKALARIVRDRDAEVVFSTTPRAAMLGGHAAALCASARRTSRRRASSGRFFSSPCCTTWLRVSVEA